MTVATSRIPAVTTALVSVFTAAMTGLRVFDGPYIDVPDGDYLTVGWTPTGELTSGQQTWSDSGNRLKDEQIDVPCYIDSYSGTVDMAARRAAVFTFLAAAEAAIHADSTLGGVVPKPAWVQISSYTAYAEQTEAGCAVGVVFHVTVDSTLY